MSHRRDDRGEGSRGGGGSYYDDRDRRSGGYRDDHRDDRRGYQEGGRGGEGQRQDRPGGHGYNSGGSGGYDRPARFEGQHRGAPHEQHRQGGRGGPGYQAGGRGRGQFDGGRGRGRAQGFPVDPGRLPPEWEEGIGQVPGEFMEVPGLVPSQQKARGSNFAGIQPMQRPKAGGYGTLGKSIRLYANHFLVQRCNNLAVHYHVEIQREYDEAPDSTGSLPKLKPLTREQHRELITKLAEEDETRLPFGHAYDGNHILFCPGRLPPDLAARLSEGVPIIIQNRRRQTRFTINIREVAVVDLKSLKEDLQGERLQEAMQAMDIVLRHRVGMIPAFQKIGASVFFHEPYRQARGHGAPERYHTKLMAPGIDIVQGYQLALQNVEGGTTVAVGLSFATFIEPKPGNDFLVAKAGMRNEEELARALNEHNGAALHRRLSSGVRGMRFKALHMNGSEFKAKGLLEAASKLRFNCNKRGEEPREITVQQYFRERYNRELQYPHLPCIDAGTPRKPVAMPPEICEILPGQRKPLTEVQKALLPVFCTSRPAAMKDAIEHVVRDVAKFPKDPTPRSFGMEIVPKMLDVMGRELEPPTLQYVDRNFKQVEVIPSNGSWEMYVKFPDRPGQLDLRFREPADLQSWAVIVMAVDSLAGAERNLATAVERYVADQRDSLEFYGLQVPDKPPNVYYYDGRDPVKELMMRANEGAAKKYGRKCQILLVIFPDKRHPLYGEVKRVGDNEIGVVTQCVAQPTINLEPNYRSGDTRRRNVTKNISLKMNAKLGGFNAAIDFYEDPRSKNAVMNEPCIIFGADVTHPGAGADNQEPSVAAIVATMDPFACKYAGRVIRQPHRTETIIQEDLKAVVLDLTRQWAIATNMQAPDRVIYFRDGVDDGAFAAVLKVEWTALQEAFAELWEEIRSKDPHFNSPVPKVTFILTQKRHITRFFPASREQGDKNGNIKSGTVVDRTVTKSFGFDFYLCSHAALQGTSRPCHYHVLLDANGFTADDLEMFCYALCHLYCRSTKSVSIVPPIYYAHLAANRGKVIQDQGDNAIEGFNQVHDNLQEVMFWV